MFNRMEQEQTELAYIGGIVLQPKKGLYHNLIVVDVASLYPTMAILHNISFDTVNCQCCKDNSESRIEHRHHKRLQNRKRVLDM